MDMANDKAMGESTHGITQNVTVRPDRALYKVA